MSADAEAGCKAVVGVLAGESKTERTDVLQENGVTRVSGRTAIILGGFLLGLGLLMALISVQYNARAMGKAALGVAVLAPEEGSPEWRQKERLRKVSDGAFYLGVVFSMIGVAFQTYGSVAK